MDIVFLGLVVLFLLASLALIAGCQRLLEG
jgi:hypothetical protein